MDQDEVTLEKQQYLELDVVHRGRGDHAVERSEPMLVANLLTVQFELRLTHLSVHVQSDHGLTKKQETTALWSALIVAHS